MVGHRVQVGEHAERRRPRPTARRARARASLGSARSPCRPASARSRAVAEPEPDLGRLALLARGLGMRKRLLERRGLLPEVADKSSDLARRRQTRARPKSSSAALNSGTTRSVRSAIRWLRPPGPSGGERTPAPTRPAPPELVAVRRASSSACSKSASASASWPSWVSRPPTRVSSSAWSATPIAASRSAGRGSGAAGRSPRWAHGSQRRRSRMRALAQRRRPGR